MLVPVWEGVADPRLVDFELAFGFVRVLVLVAVVLVFGVALGLMKCHPWALAGNSFERGNTPVLW